MSPVHSRLGSYVENKTRRVLRQATSFPWHIDFLDDALLGICETDLTLLGAGTGVGKTQIAAQIALEASRRGKKVLFFALEAEVGEIEDRLLYSAIAREWWKRFPAGRSGVVMRYQAWRMSQLEDELEEIEKAVLPGLNLEMAGIRTIYGEGTENGFYTVRNFADALGGDYIHDYDLVIVDHLHYFDLEDDNELRGMKKAIRLIRQSAMKAKKPVLLLAHLRKANRSQGQCEVLPDIDDFYGSGDIVKIGINVVLMARATGMDRSEHKVPSWIYLPKSRHAGDAAGYAALVNYDLRVGMYSPGYVLHRAERYSEPVAIGEDRKPKWARRSVQGAVLEGPPTNRSI